jgi:hypothetical protein
MTARRRRCRACDRRPPARPCAEQTAVVSAYLCAIDAGDDPSLEQVLTPTGPCSLEEAFVAVGAAYAARHRISSEAWRAVGVPPAVLAAARITRTSGPPPFRWSSPPDPRPG